MFPESYRELVICGFNVIINNSWISTMF